MAVKRDTSYKRGIKRYELITAAEICQRLFAILLFTVVQHKRLKLFDCVFKINV